MTNLGNKARSRCVAHKPTDKHYLNSMQPLCETCAPAGHAAPRRGTTGECMLESVGYPKCHPKYRNAGRHLSAPGLARAFSTKRTTRAIGHKQKSLSIDLFNSMSGEMADRIEGGAGGAPAVMRPAARARARSRPPYLENLSLFQRACCPAYPAGDQQDGHLQFYTEGLSAAWCC